MRRLLFLTIAAVLLAGCDREPEGTVEATPIDIPSVHATVGPEACALDAVRYKATYLGGLLETPLLVKPTAGTPRRHDIVFAYRRVQVNTDGAVNSYHSREIAAADPSVGAINIICNAGVAITGKGMFGRSYDVACRDGSYGIGAEYAKAYDILRAAGWQSKDGYDLTFKWSILAHTGDGRTPCIKPDGFFVSKTTLRLHPPADACDGSGYADSATVSGYVLPQNWFAAFNKTAKTQPDRYSGFEPGDVVITYRPPTGPQPEVWAYAVVGDAGPFVKLGEGSLALNRQIMRASGPIRTYRAAAKLDTDEIPGQTGNKEPQEIATIVFRRSAATPGGSFTADEIRTASEAALAQWGGGTLEAGKKKFLACRALIQKL